MHPQPLTATEVLARMRALMDGQRSAVLALCGPDGPRCFQMAVAPEAQGVWLATRPGSKLTLARQQPRACLFFSTARNQEADPLEAATLELQGTLEEVLDPVAATARDALAQRHPALVGFFQDPATVILRLVVLRAVLTERFQEVHTVDLGAVSAEEPFALPGAVR